MGGEGYETETKSCSDSLVGPLNPEDKRFDCSVGKYEGVPFYRIVGPRLEITEQDIPQDSRDLYFAPEGRQNGEKYEYLLPSDSMNLSRFAKSNQDDSRAFIRDELEILREDEKIQHLLAETNLTLEQVVVVASVKGTLKIIVLL